MIKRLFILMVLTAAVLSAQNVWSEPRYEIKALVDTHNKMIKASQDVTFTNESSTDLNELYFHVYANRVYTQKEKATLLQYGGFFKVNPFPEGIQFSSFKLFSVQNGDQNLSYEWQGDDKTILKVVLEQPLKSGQNITVSMDYAVIIPHTYGRFGWHDRIFTLSRWYPILSVYNEKGWNNYLSYPFHRPFFSDAAVYKIALTTPANETVIHSGNLISEDKNSDGTKTLNIDSKLPIREFSLAMSPSYKFLEEKLGAVTLRSYYLPGREGRARLALESAKDIFENYGKQFGTYPYDTFSIVPVHLGYGGEQMSNLIYVDTRVYDLPHFLNRYFDFLIAHETGHQWFYNLVGTDEYNEMWLEEGVHSYFIAEHLKKKYGPNAKTLEIPHWAKHAEIFIPELTFERSRDYRYKLLSRIGLDHAVAGPLASFNEPSSIFAITYGKGSRIVGMLRHYMGDDAFEKAFRRIFDEYKYKNLSIAEFKKICEDESTRDLKFFFDQWLYTDKYFDVAVKRVQGRQITLINRGEVVSPVDVRVRYRDGTEELLKDKSIAREDTLTVSKSGIKDVLVDPHNELLDLDLVNNSWPRKLRIYPVPLYHGLYDIPLFLPDDSYNVVVGPELANGGIGGKVSVQKPYDQNFYAASDYEFSESILHTRVGYQINNVFHSQTAAGFEIANRTDYDNGDEDLVSGKAYIRKELWPVPYGLFSINDHISLYLIRNRGLNPTLLTGGSEDTRNVSYMKRNESIVGTSLHFERATPYPDPSRGYKIDTVMESSGHFLNATQYFNRASLDTSFYQPVTLNSKIALRLKYGWGSPNDKNLYELGGPDGLRGYDRKDVRGADAFLGSAEYRFPIKQNLKWQFFDNILGVESVSGVVFVDAGQSWYSSFEDSDLKKDAGLGLRVTMNIGSFLEKAIVRMDVAKPINETEDDAHFWFGLNNAF